MSDEANGQDLQIDFSADISPLQELAIESHEIFEELIRAGFPIAVATQIIAHQIAETIMYMQRDESEDEDDTEDDTDD